MKSKLAATFRYATLRIFPIGIVLVLGARLSSGQGILDGLPDEFEIQAVGTYRASEPVDIQLDDSGHKTTLASVIVNKPEIPVVLVLSAYDPVVWKVGRTEETEIAGVIVSGYHGQALIGIDEDTPFAISTYEEGGDFKHFVAFRASDELLDMDDRINELLGQRIKLFQNEPVGDAFVIGSPADPDDVIYSDHLTLEDYRDPHRPLAGQEGLDTLVAAQKLRPATEQDIEAWVEKASEPYLKFNGQLRVEPPMRLSRTYVVLDTLTLPPGLYGAHSRSFLLPEDIPFPSGPTGHNSFYSADGNAINLRPASSHTHSSDDSALVSIFDGLGDDFKLYAVGTYKGKIPLEIQLDDSGNEVTQAEVIVNEPETPVVLMLTAYDPVVWRVGITEGTHIAGVIVSGYHGQALIGIEQEIPFIISTHEVPGDFAYMYAYKASHDLLDINERLKVVAGKELDYFYFQPVNGVFEVGAPIEEGQPLHYSDDLTLAGFVDPGRPLAGQRGIDQLLSEGRLRPATVADISAWIDEESEVFQDLAPGIRVSSHLHPQNTYVVLEQLTLPNGLFGAHARTFLIPNDVPFPDGDPGHSQLLRIDVDISAVVARLVVDFEFWVDELQESLGVDTEFMADSDSDSDGVKDILEFLMGSNPLDPTSRGGVKVSVDYVDGAPFVSLVLPIRNNGLGIEGILESSSDGLQWQEVSDGFEMVGRRSNNDWSDLVYFRSTNPISRKSRLSLFRLRAASHLD